MTVKIGLLASGSGSALNHIISITKTLNPLVSFYGISDRKCGAFDVIRNHCDAFHLETTLDRELLSQSASKFFKDNQCDLVLLMYSRLVSSHLFDSIKCVNVHPSLLPSYTGFKAVKRAFDDKSYFIGVTLHLVDQSVDSGPIIAQVKIHPAFYNLDYWLSVSYLMKISLVSAFLCSLKASSQGNIQLINSFSIPEALPEQFHFLNLLASNKIVEQLRPIFLDSQAASFPFSQ
tara:strand:- start:1813 stop:2511 length:699 start_codon:yes stop_codon:yes gene_type:complete